jgi:hypothetical protein
MDKNRDPGSATLSAGVSVDGNLGGGVNVGMGFFVAVGQDISPCFHNSPHKSATT